MFNVPRVGLIQVTSEMHRGGAAGTGVIIIAVERGNMMMMIRVRDAFFLFRRFHPRLTLKSVWLHGIVEAITIKVRVQNRLERPNPILRFPAAAWHGTCTCSSRADHSVERKRRSPGRARRRRKTESPSLCASAWTRSRHGYQVSYIPVFPGAG